MVGLHHPDPLARPAADAPSTAGTSVPPNRKMQLGGRHQDRNARFVVINTPAEWFQRGRQPVLSIDMMESGLVTDFKNGGRE